MRSARRPPTNRVPSPRRERGSALPCPARYRYQLATDVPTTLSLTIDDGQARQVVRYTALTTHHDVPVLGVPPDRDLTLRPTVTNAEGHETSFAPRVVRTQPLDVPLPALDLLVHEAGQPEPGLTVLPVQTADAAVIVVVNAEGQPVWALPTDEGARGLRFFGNGELAWVMNNRIVHTTVFGTPWTVYGNRAWQPDVDVDVGRSFHHDVWPNPDGTFTALSAEAVDVPAYPVDVTQPLVHAPARIRADVIVTFDRAGTVLREVRLAELLDTERIGFGATDTGRGLPEWTHANAVVPWDGGFVVSSRHQDALFAIDATPVPSLRWILGHPLGWRAPWSEARLTAADPSVAWPFHQHAPDLRATDEGVAVLLFDNGNHARTSPYGGAPHPDGDVSRVVEYRIDEATGTVTQTFELIGDGRGQALFSNIMGNADHLPQTGHVLATYPSLWSEGPKTNRDLGWGDRSTRVFEVDPATQAIVWDLRVRSDAEVAPSGWRGDRALRLPGLYGELATVTWP